MIRKIIISSLAAVIVLATAAPTYALGDRLVEKTTDRAPRQIEKTVEVAEETGQSTVERATATDQTQKEKIEARKADLLEKLSQKAADRKEKLEGRRLAQCENRQQKINDLIDRSVVNGQKQLDAIDHVKAQVEAFYAKKALSNTEYDTALSNVEQARVDATAALGVMASKDFDCQAVDGAKPSQAIVTTQQSRKAAFTAYRRSVIELIQVTKQAFAASQQGDQDVQN